MKKDNTKNINKNQNSKILKRQRVFRRLTKQDLRANGLSLLPLALRPGLLRNLAMGLGILASYFIFQNSYASNASAESLTLTIPSDPLSLNLIPAADAAFAKSSIGQITVKTSNSSGYTLSIKSTSEDDADGAKLKNSLSGSSIDSLSETASEDDFKSNPKFNNAWGYSPSKFNSIANTDFMPAPTTTSAVLDKTVSANDEEANNYDFTVAAKIDQSMPSGNYSNTFVLSATANPMPEMQDWKGCDSLKEHQTAKLLDIRDNNVYTVAKLKDGKCWMTENLRLGDEKLSDRILTSDNTDTTSNYTLPASSTSGFSDNAAQNLYVGAPWNSYTSGYYSWCAATAGTCSSATSDGQNAPSSICPKGWRLPTGGSGGEEETMANKYGSSSNGSAWSSALQAAPAHFNLSGYYQNSTFNAGGTNGRFWSSTAYSSAAAYNLLVYTTNVTPTANHGRYIGRPVRCVARQNIEYNITFNDNSGSGGPGVQSGTTDDGFIKLDSTKPNRSGYEFKGWCTTETSDETCSGKTYQPGDDYPLSNDVNTLTLYAMWETATMQNWTGCSKLSEHETVTLTDTRDNNTYTVSKLKDGRCWMTQNLRIVNKTLNSIESDVSSDFTVPASSMSGFPYDGNSHVAYAYVHSLYGGYYNWWTATAGTGLRTLGKNTDAPSSICPKKWKLPSLAERDSLLSQYSKSQLLNSPANFVMGGGVLDSSLQNTGQGYGYWTRTTYDTQGVQNGKWSCAYPITYGTIIDSDDDCGRETCGWSVRCIFDNA